MFRIGKLSSKLTLKGTGGINVLAKVKEGSRYREFCITFDREIQAVYHREEAVEYARRDKNILTVYAPQDKACIMIRFYPKSSSEESVWASLIFTKSGWIDAEFCGGIWEISRGELQKPSTHIIFKLSGTLSNISGKYPVPQLKLETLLKYIEQSILLPWQISEKWWVEQAHNKLKEHKEKCQCGSSSLVGVIDELAHPGLHTQRAKQGLLQILNNHEQICNCRSTGANSCENLKEVIEALEAALYFEYWASWVNM